MRGALILLAALTLGTALPGARATTAPTLTLTQQARKADVIVRATLGTPTNVTEGEATWVTYPLMVTEAVAGDPASLPQREGRPVLYVLQGLEDLPELRAGQEAFLLLYSRRMDNPIVGFAQGVYPVVNGRVTRPPGETAGTGAATAPASTPAPGPATSTPGAGTPPASGSGAATPATAPGTTTTTAAPGPNAATPSPTSASGSGSAPPPGSAAAPPTTAPGTAAPPSAPGAGTANPGPAAGSPPATPPPTPGNATPATATPPAANAPAPFPSDPAAFRDALRAARGGR